MIFVARVKLFYIFLVGLAEYDPKCPQSRQNLRAPYATKQAKSARILCPPQSRQTLRAPYVHHKTAKICAHFMSTTRQEKVSVQQMSTAKQANSACALCPPQSRQNLRAPYVHHKAGKICAHLMSTTGFKFFLFIFWLAWRNMSPK